MWPNNGYGNNGHFPQNGFNQDDFAQSQFNGGNPQQIFPTQPNIMPFGEEMNGDSFMAGNNFQPEVGLYNDAAFMQNQFVNPVSFCFCGHSKPIHSFVATPSLLQTRAANCR